MTPLAQVSNVSTPDAKTIAVQPWEKNMIDPIERAIQQANVGITPANNGEVIRLNIPPLTEERRIELRGFGSFAVRKRKARCTKNPKTGAIMDIPERKTIHFTMSKSLKEALIKE